MNTNKTIFGFITLLVLVMLMVPVSTNALDLRLNVDYPRLPVPGGSFDINKAIEKQNLTGEQVVTLGVVIIFVFVASIWVSGFVLLISLIYTGFAYITSGANPGKRAKALNRLTNIFWGIGILLFAYIIVFIISPDVVKLKLTGTEHVQKGSAVPASNELPEDTAEESSDTPIVCTGNGTLVDSAVHQEAAEEICADNYQETATDGNGDHNEIGIYIMLELDTEDETACGDGDVSEVKNLISGDGALGVCS